MNSATNRSLSTSIRILVVAFIVPAVAFIAWLMNAAMKPPEVQMPGWSFRELPRQLGEWQGENSEMDPEIFKATGAKIIEDRIYQDVSNHSIRMHTAFFEDPAAGVYHNPMNCYRANGWARKNLSLEPLKLSNDKTLEVNFSTWTLGNDRVYVVYWYQLGEHVLYGRDDLGFNIRWAMRGQNVWPALIKVMLQIPVPAETDESKTLVLDFAKRIASWMNEQEKRDEAKENANCSIRSVSEDSQKTE
jgi:EpsI family protein